ncbi:MAG: GNAT family N-acetyltransferase [Candidatus Gracilibacteria bacterium]|nr:GNAT family N-acetyltransferase [Candidatus Gracilibacteria bacterium]MDQ7023491.1 GNAT family N-acetyltransferase [Candidatus Gracilibacteria bacterium]
MKNINIELVKINNKVINDFEGKEWIIADIEHYGKADINFEKKKYQFIAKNDLGEIMGVLNLVIEVNLAFIDSLLVGHKYRRMGVGKKLLTKAENIAKENNCSKIYLETNKGWKAVKFYEKYNYKITGIHEKHILGQDTLIFTKFF